MIFSIFLIVLSLASISFGACDVQTVSDTTTKDTPSFVSGAITSDTLAMTFDYDTYGAEGDISYASTGLPNTPAGTNWARYIDTANTGFAQVADATAVLCPGYTLASQIQGAAGSITNIITYNDPTCVDIVSPSVTWSTAKSSCGNLYFVSSGGTNGAPYVVNFVYRITYIEQLSSGDTRTVSNDYAFSVSSPTEFTIDSASFQLANVATQVSQQIVKVDSTGKVTLTVQAIALCDATLTAVNIGTLNQVTTGTPQIASSGAPGTAYAAGTKYAGLCPYTWTVDVTPSGGCSLNGNFHVTYDFTPTGSTSFTSPNQIVVLSSSDACTVQQVAGSDWGNGDFQLELRTASNGTGNVLSANTVVNYGQTAHWRIVASKSTSDVPVPSSFAIKTLATKLGSASVFSGNLVGSGTLLLSNNDGGTNGVSGTATSYSLYWSHKWTTDDFPSSGTRTPVTLQVTFDVAYPAVPTTSTSAAKRLVTVAPVATAAGRRNFFEHRVVSRSTTSFGLESPRFVMSSTSSADRALIIGLSVMGGVLAIGAAVVVIIVLRRRGRKLPSPEEPAPITVEEIKDFQ